MRKCKWTTIDTMRSNEVLLASQNEWTSHIQSTTIDSILFNEDAGYIAQIEPRANLIIVQVPNINVP